MLDLKNKKIIVTGGAGFLGKSVVRKLDERGCKNIFVPTIEEYDLRGLAAIKKMYTYAKADMVIHLAATVGGIGANLDKPGSYFYDNLIMGIQLIEQARANDIEKFVIIGTICAYPKFTPVPFREENLWNGYPDEVTGPYGLAKKMLLVQSQAYRQQYGFNSIFLLPVNLYGPGDNFDPKFSHVVPALIRKFYEAKINDFNEVIVWGTGKATREFIYAEDCAEGIVKAAQSYDKSEPVNIGTGIETPIKDLAEKIKDLIGYKGRIVWDSSKPDGQPRRCLDVSRALKEFGFKAKTNFDEGLKKTIQWYINSSTR
ncbi:MAG: GDP-L-fucose synthase [Actinobacteria bacterium]|nr:GDP-L-fucose synthase [Actinomycetota bacterium]